jgi:hypothetical protein
MTSESDTPGAPTREGVGIVEMERERYKLDLERKRLENRVERERVETQALEIRTERERQAIEWQREREMLERSGGVGHTEIMALLQRGLMRQRARLITVVSGLSGISFLGAALDSIFDVLPYAAADIWLGAALTLAGLAVGATRKSTPESNPPDQPTSGS